MTTTGDLTGTHVDLILHEIGSLPTLSTIAVKVMRLASGGDADLREIARLIESDPALTAKVLALCRRADLGMSRRITTVDRAVVMLGLEAVRAALLSVEIHEVFSHALEKGRPAPPTADPAVDRKELWRHSIAVASAAELLAESNTPAMAGHTPQEAFLAGLLHDLGKVALDALLPLTYERVAALARERGLNIAEVERRVIGLDHHAAGKRLAEHWGLPHALQDVMWLHGQPAKLLPDVPHRALISVVTLADAQVRALHLGWCGNYAPLEDRAALLADTGFKAPDAPGWERTLIERVAQRCRDMGMDDAAPAGLMLESLARANAHLGQVTALLDRRAREAQRSETALTHAAKFLSGEAGRRTLTAALTDTGRHAAEVIGGPFLAIVTEVREGSPWLLHHVTRSDAVSHSTLTPPTDLGSLSLLTTGESTGTKHAALVAWLAEQIRDEGPARALRVIPLVGSGGGLSAVLLHSNENAQQLLGCKGLDALAAAWGASLASASRHDGARRLGEQLADANRRLAEAQSKLVEQRSMVHVCQIAAGAAHEMNNPLTVISGKAQVLIESLREPEKQAAAVAIVRAADKLTELITSLHLFADPPRPKRAPANLPELLHRAVKSARQRAASVSAAQRLRAANINISCDRAVPTASVDAEQITQAVTELVVNALQASPKNQINVRAQADPFDDRLIISVTDDGSGMSASALEHATDPFFSELPAGRRTGLGLTRARRYADLHGGELTLQSEPGKGTVARIILPDWRDARSPQIAGEAA
jgi:signal transduction histidine kinase/HD-like signal output (HDOD) protein